MALRDVVQRVLNRKKSTMTQETLTPTKITGGTSTGGIVTGGSTDVTTSSTGAGDTTTYRRSSGRKWEKVETPIPEVKIPVSVGVKPSAIKLPSTSVVSGVKLPTYQQGNQQGTSIISAPTMEELKRQAKLNENVATASYQDLWKQQQKIDTSVVNMQKIITDAEEVAEQIEKLNKELEAEAYNLKQYDKYINEDDKFVGTKEEYDAYLNDFDRYQTLYKDAEKKVADYQQLATNYDIETKKIKSAGGSISDKGVVSGVTAEVGVGPYTQKVDISRFKNIYSNRPLLAAGTTYSLLAQTELAVASRALEQGLNVLGMKTGKRREGGSYIWRNPSKSVTTIKERIGTQYFIPQGTIQDGKTTPYTQQVFIPDITITKEKKQVTSQSIGETYFKVTSIAAELLKYSIPYAGTAFYIGEVGEKIRTYGGVKKYFRAKPGEVILTTAALATPFLIKGYKYLKAKSIEKGIRTQLNLLRNPKLKAQLFKGKGLIVDVKTKEVVYAGSRSLKKGGPAIVEIGFQGRLLKKGITGTGIMTSKGIVQPTLFGIKLKPRAYSVEQFFSIRTTGKSKLLGTAFLKKGGPATSAILIPTKTKVYKLLGATKITPYSSGKFGITKVKSATLTELEKVKFKMTPIKFEKTKIYDISNNQIFLKGKGAIGKQISVSEFEKGLKGLTFNPERATELTDVLVIPKKLGKDISSVKKIVTGGKKSSSAFLQGLYATPAISIPILSKLPKVSAVTPIVTLKSSTSASTIPKFWGQGLYERTEEYSSLLPTTTTLTGNLALVEYQEKVTSPKPVVIPTPKPRIKEETTIIPIQPIIQPQPQIQPTRQELKIKQVEKLSQEQVLLSALKSSSLQKISGFKFANFDFSKLKATSPTSFTSKELFSAFAIKSGKPFKIGDFAEKPKASKELGKFLISTLSASGFITKGGKKLKAEETGLLDYFEFRKSKASPFLVVEKKSKRLRKGTTGKGIQAFRFR